MLLRMHQVSRVFLMGDVKVHALEEIDWEISEGEFAVILGPSGSGKSTLLNLAGGIDRPTTGEVWYRDHLLSSESDSELTQYRRDHVGFIFQFYNLIPTLTARENVQAAAELVSDPMDSDAALELVDLGDRKSHFPSQLSGGEQQRVAIARALVKKPTLLLADEPTGALDLETAQRVLGILQKLNRTQKLTTILITHNTALAGIAGSVVRLVSGHIAETMTNDHPIDASQVHW